MFLRRALDVMIEIRVTQLHDQIAGVLLVGSLEEVEHSNKEGAVNGLQATALSQTAFCP